MPSTLAPPPATHDITLAARPFEVFILLTGDRLLIG